jgi:hypothetical protein
MFNIQYFLDYFHTHIMFLNNSKIFAGIMMICINLLTKFVPIQFSKSLEEILKTSVNKFFIVFCLSWMGTRDIYVAIIMAITFIIFSDYLMNEECPYCIIPEKHRILTNIVTKDVDEVSDAEHQQAIYVLEKYKRQKQREQQRTDLLQFHQWESAIKN